MRHTHTRSHTFMFLDVLRLSTIRFAGRFTRFKHWLSRHLGTACMHARLRMFTHSYTHNDCSFLLIFGPICRITKICGVARRSTLDVRFMTTSAPPPLHIIRSHTSAISALFISDDNERIYSGDISGLAVITSTRSLRPLASWKAHTDGLLGLEEWGNQVITSVCDPSLFKNAFCCIQDPDALFAYIVCPLKSHGRDNKLHVWKLSSQTLSTLGGSALAPGTLILELCYTLDVNALNFCRFSLLSLDVSPAPSADMRMRALVAVPNLVESSLASPNLLRGSIVVAMM